MKIGRLFAILLGSSLTLIPASTLALSLGECRTLNSRLSNNVRAPLHHLRNNTGIDLNIPTEHNCYVSKNEPYPDAPRARVVRSEVEYDFFAQPGGDHTARLYFDLTRAALYDFVDVVFGFTRGVRARWNIRDAISKNMSTAMARIRNSNGHRSAIDGGQKIMQFGQITSHFGVTFYLGFVEKQYASGETYQDFLAGWTFEGGSMFENLQTRKENFYAQALPRYEPSDPRNREASDFPFQDARKRARGADSVEMKALVVDVYAYHGNRQTGINMANRFAQMPLNEQYRKTIEAINRFDSAYGGRRGGGEYSNPSGWEIPPWMRRNR